MGVLGTRVRVFNHLMSLDILMGQAERVGGWRASGYEFGTDLAVPLFIRLINTVTYWLTKEEGRRVP